MTSLRYYDPKKTGKELGQIVLTQDGKVKKGTKKDPTGFDKKVRPQTSRAERSNPFALACPASLLLTAEAAAYAVKDVSVQADRGGQEEP